MSGDALEEYARIERELGRIDADLADLAIDMYNDYRWLGVTDPLAVDVGGSPRWQHVKWLEQGRMELWYAIEMWHRDHPDDSAHARPRVGQTRRFVAADDP